MEMGEEPLEPLREVAERGPLRTSGARKELEGRLKEMEEALKREEVNGPAGRLKEEEPSTVMVG